MELLVFPLSQFFFWIFSFFAKGFFLPCSNIPLLPLTVINFYSDTILPSPLKLRVFSSLSPPQHPVNRNFQTGEKENIFFNPNLTLFIRSFLRRLALVYFRGSFNGHFPPFRRFLTFPNFFDVLFLFLVKIECPALFYLREIPPGIRKCPP